MFSFSLSCSFFVDSSLDFLARSPLVRDFVRHHITSTQRGFRVAHSIIPSRQFSVRLHLLWMGEICYAKARCSET